MENFKQNIEKINLCLEKEFKQVQNHKNFNNSDKYNLLSEKGKYYYETLMFYIKLNKLLDDLNMIETFITTYPKEIYKENKINEIKFINYHLEVFYHKISTILDIIKLFISHVFELRLRPKDCNWENLKKRENDITSEVFDVIVRYYESFESMIKIRDLNTHRLSNVNPSSNQLSTLLLILETFEKGKHLVSKQALDYSLQKHREKIIEHIKSASAVAKKYVDEFIDKILLVVVTRGNSK